MQVTDKMPMHEYDAWTQERRLEKVPKHSSDPRYWVGDALYDFSEDPPRQRWGVHEEANRKSDLSGEYALLSEHFFYFGDQPVALPENLQGMVHSGRGHSSRRNAPYLDPFVDWLTVLGLKPNRLYGKPQKGPLSRSVIGLDIPRK